jgi:TetR/AcrR family transcriptional regulator, regulator of autoinduction and epiphytic fitness
LEKDRKLQIVKAAEKRFVKHGLHKTTLDEIARDLRIGKSTIYHYFTSKEDLYFGTLRWQVEQYHQQLKNILSQDKNISEVIEEYYKFKDSVFENYKLLLPLFIHFMNESNFAEELIILQELYLTEENLLKETFSKINFKSDDLNFSLHNFIVHQSWGLAAGKQITKDSEELSRQINSDILKSVFNSLLSTKSN